MEKRDGHARGGHASAADAARCFLALSLLLFGNWSLNSHLFPLYDVYAPSIRELCTAANGAVLVGLAVLSVRRPRALSPWMLLAVATAGTVSGATVVFAGEAVGQAGVLAAGACILSVSRGVCVLLVGLLLCRQVENRAFLLIVAAEFASTALSSVCPAGYSAFWLGAHVLMLLAVVALSYSGARQTLDRLDAPPSPHDAAITQPASYLPFGHQVFVCLLLFRVVYGFVLTFGETESVPASSSWGLVVLASVLCVRLSRPESGGVDRLFRLAFLLVVAGILLVPASQLVRFSIPNGLISCGIAAFEVFNWVVLVSLARRNTHAAASVFAWGFALNALGVIVGANIGRFVNGYWRNDSQVVVLVVAVMVFLLVAYVVVVLRDFSFDATISGVREAEPAPRFEATGEVREGAIERACALLAVRCGLTKRESEVFRLLARGRTGVFIQKELCVSYNTIKAHVKHIYQKLDVHTHQELIDLVEAQGAGEGASREGGGLADGAACRASYGISDRNTDSRTSLL